MSMCTPPEEAQGTHVFNILGYNKHRGMGHDDNSYIRSGVFMVGDHNWVIRFYPDGYKGEGQDYISVYLELVCITERRASCDMRLVDQCTGISYSMHKTGPRILSGDISRFAPLTPIFIRRSEIGGFVYLRNDRLTIECTATVFQEATCYGNQNRHATANMTDHVAKLLEEKEGFDVSFIVGGEMIEAHRFVLAIRSPVSKEELYGSMQETRPGQCITIQDMQPAVFKALLHFIYTDSLPSCEDEMVRLLLVAADRYGMDRLKLVCQSILCEDLNKDTVATTLTLAHQHNCHQLKDACLQFNKLSGFKDVKDVKVTCQSFIEDTLEKRRKSS
ncbi:hypothetical protein VPH35_086297 [Triticum aestivum]